METFLTPTMNYLLKQSWQIAILVTVISVVTWVLRNRSAHFRYLLWLIVLAKCLAPPLLQIQVAVLPEKEPSLAAITTPIQAVVKAPLETTTPAKPLSVVSPLAYSRPELSTQQWLAIGWLAGMLAFTCMTVVKAYRTVRWIHRDRKPLPRDVQKDINNLFVSLNLRKLPRMWLLDGIGQPFVWGVLRGDIYLPAAFICIENDEHRRHILGHELSHVMRFDVAVNLLQTIAQVVFWFHPLVWWANRKIRAEREKCCDEMTIARFAARAKDYSKAIVDTLTNEYESNRPLPSLAIAGPIHNIEERIRTIMRPQKRFYRRPSIITLIVVLVLALATVPTSLILTAQAEDKSSSQENVSSNTSANIAEDDKLERVRRFIDRLDDINIKDTWGYTPLHRACMNGERQIAELLIENGADVNAKSVIGVTPLHAAAGRGQADVARLLLAKNADINAADNQGATPLWYAKNGVVFTFSVTGKLNKQATAIWDPDNPGCKEIAEILRKMGAKEQAPVVSLHEAARDGLTDKVKSLISKGADVNAMDERLAATPLHLAVYFANTEVVNLLIASGADVNARNKWNRTPLNIAIDKGYADYVELLRKHGAKVDAPSVQAKALPVESVFESATSRYAIPQKALEIPEQMKSCAANLQKIHAAIRKYEEDKGMVPFYLSDLIPDYVSKDTFFCPNNPKATVTWPYDPKLVCSYRYEFSPFRGRARFGGGPFDGMTWRDRKAEQIQLFGDVVPIVRCPQHGRTTLNVAVSGQIYSSGPPWESTIVPDYKVGDELEGQAQR